MDHCFSEHDPFVNHFRAEADINEYEKVAGRDVLMIAMQREEEPATSPWMTNSTNIALYPNSNSERDRKVTGTSYQDSIR